MLIRLGEIIKDAREYKKITRAELAEYVCVLEEKIEEIKENRIVPDFDTALPIFNFLDIEVDWSLIRSISVIKDFMERWGK